VGHVAADDKSYLLGRADWFLLPSYQENFGVAVLEAVQARCAVAISDQVYIAEFFRPESEVLPLDESAWVKFMRERMVDGNWRREVSTKDYNEIARTMNEEAVLDGWRQALLASFTPRSETRGGRPSIVGLST
jgi:glycosyltransferase involved in cell wall biosynthesis